MPKLGKKSYPYTKAGKAAYKKAKRYGKKYGGALCTNKAMNKARPN